ncbi:MAG: glycoside hydrolase family 38 C-terminal domain-containing protein, partial [Spirochaetales bacterium]|nr:glycoside hydrolase family 38 C-terminal domain-containing protein [Spirochaetales bacterium]
DKGENLPVWDDEFYLEAHRGTYTSKGDLKKLNRKGELLYRDAEILSSLAFAKGMDYSMEELNKGWKLLLLNQFHDTLPGSHVPEAVPDMYRDYEELYAIGESVKKRALGYLVSRMTGNFGFTVFNTLSWDRRSVVSIPWTEEAGSVCLGGEHLSCQKKGDQLFFDPSSLPSMGWISGNVSSEKAESENSVKEIPGGIETEFYRIEWDSRGWLKSVYDKENNRQVLQGRGNELLVFEDDPGKNFGAWDIASHYNEYSYDVNLVRNWTLRENGPVFAELEAEWSVLDSKIVQTMRVFRNHRSIEFDTFADWQNSKKLLKTSFDLAVRSRRATYDLPFGHIERTTHSNTSWDQARFEVCGHKWADLSEGDYGVALMNDCKYGYDAQDNILRLSLLRSPVKPDKTSDIGEHRFSYALLPHKGIWQQGAVDRRAYEFNIPPVSEVNTGERASDNRGGAVLPPEYSFLNLKGEGQIVEALKPSEDGRSLILRSFDSHNTHTRTAVHINHKLAACQSTDLLEQAEETLYVQDNEIDLLFSPMEIKTCRLELSVENSGES